MENLETTKKMYAEIMKTLNKFKGTCVFDVPELEKQSKIHIYGLQLKEEYGLNIEPKKIHSIDYNRYGDYKSFGQYGEKYKRTISYSIDGRQPDDELLFVIAFATGSYIFGDGGFFNKEYPEEFFQKFWLELKSYKPDYIDEANHSLFWKIENAKIIFNEFDDILKKYNKLNEEDIKQRKIKKIKKDLAKLENSI